MLQGRPQVSRAGWRVGAGQATSDLGPEPSGDRRSPGPTLWAEAADRREGSQRQLCECLEGEAREAVEEQLGARGPC